MKVHELLHRIQNLNSVEPGFMNFEVSINVVSKLEASDPKSHVVELPVESTNITWLFSVTHENKLEILLEV